MPKPVSRRVVMLQKESESVVKAGSIEESPYQVNLPSGDRPSPAAGNAVPNPGVRLFPLQVDYSHNCAAFAAAAAAASAVAPVSAPTKHEPLIRLVNPPHKIGQARPVVRIMSPASNPTPAAFSVASALHCTNYSALEPAIGAYTAKNRILADSRRTADADAKVLDAALSGLVPLDKVDHTYHDYTSFAPDDEDRRLYWKKKRQQQEAKNALDRGVAVIDPKSEDSAAIADKKGDNALSRDDHVSKLNKALQFSAGEDPNAWCSSKEVIHGTNFPAKLHDMLACDDLEDVISWLPHGRAWIVRQPLELVSKGLPRFFAQSKYSSFTRQVNGWGFKRITQGPDHNAYYHELFLKGMPHLIKWMKRPPGCMRKLVSDPRNEPNFYELGRTYLIPDYYGESPNQAPCLTKLVDPSNETNNAVTVRGSSSKGKSPARVRDAEDHEDDEVVYVVDVVPSSSPSIIQKATQSIPEHRTASPKTFNTRTDTCKDNQCKDNQQVTGQADDSSTAPLPYWATRNPMPQEVNAYGTSAFADGGTIKNRHEDSSSLNSEPKVPPQVAMNSFGGQFPVAMMSFPEAGFIRLGGATPHSVRSSNLAYQEAIAPAPFAVPSYNDHSAYQFVQLPNGQRVLHHQEGMAMYHGPPPMVAAPAGMSYFPAVRQQDPFSVTLCGSDLTGLSHSLTSTSAAGGGNVLPYMIAGSPQQWSGAIPGRRKTVMMLPVVVDSGEVDGLLSDPSGLYQHKTMFGTGMGTKHQSMFVNDCMEATHPYLMTQNFSAAPSPAVCPPMRYLFHPNHLQELSLDEQADPRTANQTSTTNNTGAKNGGVQPTEGVLLNKDNKGSTHKSSLSAGGGHCHSQCSKEGTSSIRQSEEPAVQRMPSSVMTATAASQGSSQFTTRIGNSAYY